jgi:ADP-ribose pyrophosphatase YjhB (NUDIX family)/ribosomal protein S18 acetylase RimI-like enzyme
MVVKEQDRRPRETCSHCGYIHYHNPVPGVGVIVEMEGGVVLVKRRFEPRAGWWCLPAGFLETDESAEEGAVRECKEETGLDVIVDDLFGVYSFPEGMQRSGLVIFYTAHVVGGKLHAGDDADQVRIFALNDLPGKLAFRTHREVLARLRQRAAAREDLLEPSHTGDFPSPVPDIIIHHAHAGHLSQILELLRLIPANTNLSEEDMEAVVQRFREMIGLEVLVAEADGQVVGFVALSFSSTLTGPKAWIDDIAVEPGYRRQGIGAALLEAAVRRARQRDCAYLLVNTAKGNPPAQAFYRACGFEKGGIAPLRIV